MVEETSPELFLDDEAWRDNDLPPLLKKQRVKIGIETVITREIPRNLVECPVCFHALTIPTFQVLLITTFLFFLVDNRFVDPVFPKKNAYMVDNPRK